MADQIAQMVRRVDADAQAGVVQHGLERGKVRMDVGQRDVAHQVRAGLSDVVACTLSPGDIRFDIPRRSEEMK